MIARKINIVAFLVILCLATSCRPNRQTSHIFPIGPKEEQVDKSLLTGVPCSIPCWYGIEPGETSYGDALDTVSKLRFVNEVYSYPQSHELKWSSSITNWGGGYITFESNNEEVKEISYVLEYKLTLQELIASQGDPDEIMIFPFGGEQNAGEIQIIWLDKGLIARIPVGGMDTREYYKKSPVSPTTRIDGIILTVPTYLTQLMSVNPDRYYEWNDYQPLPSETPLP